MMPEPLPPHRKLLRNLKRAFRRPIAGYRDYQALLRGQHGLEIGGPTKLFRRDLPIYEVVAGLDGVNFSSSTVWEGQIAEGQAYRYGKRRAGRQFICDATDLGRLPAQRYDFVVSCNNLEHIANPLKAVGEWLRVVRPGGYLLLVLPKKESNFEHQRETTSFLHLLTDHDNGTDEHDLTHLDEILDRHDYSMTAETPDRDSLRARGLRNFENRCLHHHVFDLPLIEQVFAHFGLHTLLRTTIATDYIALAAKP
jgi:SAM-dependent methyltransferase